MENNIMKFECSMIILYNLIRKNETARNFNYAKKLKKDYLSVYAMYKMAKLAKERNF